ncbi:biliverdin-producing heme oxygenase [Pimelobacter simplex]|uniref:biliverdin-producing heme oxygenase n=1 Tax=Nocardioides simplex TaxID=2045 RepID=UPI002150137A|nr:biliverdin-producing heme oxygenase [Pimelobacter simplex]UUW89686.1 biliverdin-producing heme oxygenase [Pimelobacter simplex]UUW93515.1 biliverdin-producing heme oxygenase [Pimelobacter simplex]
MSVATTVRDEDLTLSTAMREGSRSEHEAAEGSTYMAELLEGRLTTEAYAALLLRLRRVYAAMEDVVRERADAPAVAAVHDAALERLAAIDADLQHWAPDTDPATVVSAATDAYVARLRAAAERDDLGGALLAHHYTRYLGDLSGGQAIGRILSRTYGLPEGVGVAFYDFAEIPKPKPYKDAYRARLDGLDLSPEQVAAVVDEVKVAFALNQAVFDELGRDIDRYRAA